MAQLKPLEGGDYYLWKYLPSLPASIIFIVLFTALTIAICWRMARTRSWFCIPFAIGGLFEIIGYVTRTYARDHTDKIPPYAVQNTGILLAPVFFAASIYMVLGRTIRAVHGERFSIVRPTWSTKILVTGDILSLLVQAGGAGLMVSSKNRDMGEYIVIGGLFIQLGVFGFFIIYTAVFHNRMKKYDTAESSHQGFVPWRKMVSMLYACSVLIVIRSVFRVIEYIMGQDAYLLSHEWTMYVFDAVLMWAVMVIFFVWFPQGLQPKKVDSIDMVGPSLASDDDPKA
ncbi:uncharacterized protein A1O9_10726 [Exophiala aquamarina CBS 119918]|uniref:RTA1 like protein n=1 Tax=Exophiala aquamarina CBS 119918 TaxID=1182545 RepID=A0A072P211_9EURO|nr:uncharacterized protein A1O9_10726 [Exophiala aquamarina CBS 119918]KEF53278.1 hypothetical protein A1O9_10726 [Exophiala aquamarina CBS 119918]